MFKEKFIGQVTNKIKTLFTFGLEKSQAVVIVTKDDSGNADKHYLSESLNTQYEGIERLLKNITT